MGEIRTCRVIGGRIRVNIVLSLGNDIVGHFGMSHQWGGPCRCPLTVQFGDVTSSSGNLGTSPGLQAIGDAASNESQYRWPWLS